MHEARDPVRIAVVGAGVMGDHHVRLLRELEQAELVGIYDSDPVAARTVSSRYGCRVVADLEQLVAGAEAAVVAAPTSTHAELGSRLLADGLHVLVEKPLAESLAAADRLLAAAGDRVLAVGHVEYHNPAVQRLLGLGLPPGFVEVHRMGEFSSRSLDVDVVLDLMIHDLQILHSLDPSPVRDLHAVGINVLTARVDIANVRLELESGCVANLTASRVSAEKIRKLRAFVPAAYYSLDYSQQRVDGVRLREKDGEREIVPTALAVERAEPLRLELEAFLSACRGESANIVDGAAGRRALETALRIVEDLASRSSEAVSTVSSTG